MHFSVYFGTSEHSVFSLLNALLPSWIMTRGKLSREENLPERVGVGKKKEGEKRKFSMFGNPRWWPNALTTVNASYSKFH